MAFYRCAGGADPTQVKEVTASTGSISVMPDSGYTLSKVIVNPTPSQNKSVTPSTSAQIITPDSGKLLSSVSVDAISPNLSTQSRYQISQGDTTPVLISDQGGFSTVYDNVTKQNVADYFLITHTGSKDKNNNTMTNGWLQTYTRLGIPAQTKSVTATTSAQVVNPDANKVLWGVVVAPQSHSGTYTFASGDTGGTKDLGDVHNYRYINAANVYAKGKADGRKLTIPVLAATSGDEGNATINTDLQITNNGYTSLSIDSFTVKVRNGDGYIKIDDTVLHTYSGQDTTPRSFNIANASTIHLHVQTYGGLQGAYMNNIVLS